MVGIGMLLGLLTLGASLTLAEEAKYFLIRLQPVRATFNDDATPEEQKVMSRHFAYLKELLKSGKLVLAGPAETGARPFGIIVVEAASIEEARQIMNGDPSVKARIMEAEVFPFGLALMRGRD